MFVRDRTNERNSALVARKRQRQACVTVTVERLVSSQGLHVGYRQGEGADLIAPWRGGSGKGELRWGGAYY
jgi:hypothetical protein